MSIGVALIVTVVFWISCFIGEGENAIFEGSRVRYGTFAALLLILFFWSFAKAGSLAWNKESVLEQVILLVLGVLCTIALEVLAMASTYEALTTRKGLFERSSNNDEKLNIAREVRIILGNRDNVTKYLCFSDLPIAFAIVSLALMIVFHVGIDTGYDEKQMRAFIAGAIALQLLYSNVVFWLEALADYPWGHRRLGHLPNWLRSIRHMLHPAGHLPSEASIEWVET
jgi:hypothetical protein